MFEPCVGGNSGRMPRQSWSGTISFGLVAIPVKLYSAVSRKSVSFNQLDDRNLARVRYRKVNAETGEEVPEDHIVKGFEVSKDRYVVITSGDLEPLVPAATKTVDLEEFVSLDEIDPLLFDTAYYVVPDGHPKPYALLCAAMAATNKVALGRFVMRSKQHVAAIRALDGRLVMSTLVYVDELVDPSALSELDAVADVEVSDREMSMAQMLVESLTTEFDVSKYSDEYSARVMELIDAKAAGAEPVASEAASAKPKVVDIMAALEASVAEAKQARTRHPTATKSAAAKKDVAGKAPGTKSPAAKRKTQPRKSA